MTTMFNGASNVAQAGGLATLTGEGYQAMLDLVAFYKENAKLLSKAFTDMGFKASTGQAPEFIQSSLDMRAGFPV